MADFLMTKSLMVTGFWTGESKYGQKISQTNEVYGNWFKNSLQINSPYLIFHGHNDDELLRRSRDATRLPTAFVELDESNFLTTKLNGHIHHIARVWNEKLDLLLMANTMFPAVEWLSWVDAGVNTFRDMMPPNVTWSQRNLTTNYPPALVFTRQGPNNHNMICGNMFMVHRSVLSEIHRLYYESFKMDAACDKSGMASCGDDQRRMIDVYERNPHLFYDASEHGECHEYPGMDCHGWDTLLWINYGFEVFNLYNSHHRRTLVKE